MGNLKLRGKDLRKINYKSNTAISIALDIMAFHFKHHSRQEKLVLLEKVKSMPDKFLEDPLLGSLAQEFAEVEEKEIGREMISLKDPGTFKVYGRKHISANAWQQMEMAMRLPIALKGALMPDAHHGYGLPIGGVLATRNTVIPYGVGLDIGCRMRLSIFDLNPGYLQKNSFKFKTALKEKTCFGSGGVLNMPQEHEVLESKAFQQTSLLRQLQGKAVKQLGTSGSGNHFVEFGIVTLHKGNGLEIEPGNYVGLLSHSGSRGLGAAVAKYYTRIAMDKCLLPREAQQLAWLDLDKEEGQEYWLSMQLAGDYAKACHEQIHYHLSSHLGIDVIAKVENHHNFAWKELDEFGESIVVHRKGATPAARGELGIIPGSMATPGYIVRGKGEPLSLNSASHGAGRKMSRTAARNSYTGSALKKVLGNAGVTLLGGGVEEAPIAYKELKEVMSCQKDLVQIIGEFMPHIVRMDKP